MKKFLIAAALLMPFGLAATPASAQAARNYDCSKAGNANKAVCKGAKPAAAPAAKPATAPRAAPAAKPMAAAPAARNYDCTKAGNANKAVCKGTATAAPATRTIAPAPRTAAPAARPAAPRVATGQAVNGAGPGGATAKCKDGSLSHSATRSGTCSRHGGVANFY